ncbi:hypothetical protein D3C85_954890 [compost metagenome]
MSVQQLIVIRGDLDLSVEAMMAITANAAAASIFWKLRPKPGKFSDGTPSADRTLKLDMSEVDVAYCRQVDGNAPFDTRVIVVPDLAALDSVRRESRQRRELWHTTKIDVTGQLFKFGQPTELGCVAIGPYPSDVIQELVDFAVQKQQLKETKMKEL